MVWWAPDIQPSVEGRLAIFIRIVNGMTKKIAELLHLILMLLIGASLGKSLLLARSFIVFIIPALLLSLIGSPFCAKGAFFGLGGKTFPPRIYLCVCVPFALCVCPTASRDRNCLWFVFVWLLANTSSSSCPTSFLGSSIYCSKLVCFLIAEGVFISRRRPCPRLIRRSRWNSIYCFAVGSIRRNSTSNAFFRSHNRVGHTVGGVFSAPQHVRPLLEPYFSSLIFPTLKSRNRQPYRVAWVVWYHLAESVKSEKC